MTLLTASGDWPVKCLTDLKLTCGAVNPGRRRLSAGLWLRPSLRRLTGGGGPNGPPRPRPPDACRVLAVAPPSREECRRRQSAAPYCGGRRGRRFPWQRCRPIIPRPAVPWQSPRASSSPPRPAAAARSASGQRRNDRPRRPVRSRRIRGTGPTPIARCRRWSAPRPRVTVTNRPPRRV